MESGRRNIVYSLHMGLEDSKELHRSGWSGELGRDREVFAPQVRRSSKGDIR